MDPRRVWLQSAARATTKDHDAQQKSYCRHRGDRGVVRRGQFGARHHPAQGNGLVSIPATCNGEETTLIASKGATFYVDGQKYVLQSFSLSDGATVIDSREWGNRNGLDGGSIECTGTSPGNPALTFHGIGVSQ